MTKADREKIKATTKAVVKKGKKKDGSTCVSVSQYISRNTNVILMVFFLGSRPRTGVKGALRATQEYPVGFAAAVAELHLQDLHEKEATPLARD